MKLPAVVCAMLLLPAAGCAPGRVSSKPVQFTSTAVIAMLPGNPFQTRLYSLARHIRGQGLYQELTSRQGAAEPEKRLAMEWRPDADFVIRYRDDDGARAARAVKRVMEALIGEMDRRASRNPGYGGGRVHTPARPVTAPGWAGAEGVLRIEGLSWDAAADRATQAQMAEVKARILDQSNLRDAVTLGGFGSMWREPEVVVRMANELRSAVSFAPLNDSKVQVSMVASDRMRVPLLGLLLAAAEKRDVKLDGRIPAEDLDFVRPQLRRDWYIFNCCQAGAREPR